MKRWSQLRGETLWSLAFFLSAIENIETRKEKRIKRNGSCFPVYYETHSHTPKTGIDDRERPQDIVDDYDHFSQSPLCQNVLLAEIDVRSCDKTSHYQNLLNRRLTIAVQKLLFTRSFTWSSPGLSSCLVPVTDHEHASFCSSIAAAKFFSLQQTFQRQGLKATTMSKRNSKCAVENNNTGFADDEEKYSCGISTWACILHFSLLDAPR